MCNLISSNKNSVDLSIGSHRKFETQERELTNKETTEGTYFVSAYSKDLLIFTEHHENFTYGSG